MEDRNRDPNNIKEGDIKQNQMKGEMRNPVTTVEKAEITNQQKQRQQQRVKKTTDSSEDSDDGFLQQTARHPNYEAKKVRSSNKTNTVRLRIADLDADLDPDSGASINIMDEYQFRALKHRSQEIQGLSPSNAKLKTLQSSLEVKGMLKIDPEGTLKERNNLRIKKVQTSSQIEALLAEYSDAFHGIGCFKEKETGEKMQVKLEMEPQAKPVAQKPRNVPYHLQQPLKQWIDEGVEKEIFEKVPPGEAITWCSPLVVQPKPKFAETNKNELESHMIRASIDMRIPNESMKMRAGTKDLGFHLPPIRLQSGRNAEEHQQVLRTVLQRARHHGVTFNEDKCEFEKEEIEFFGHIFTKDGLKPSPEKVKAIKECKAPQSKEEVRSFLGMAGYLDNFIPNYASIAAPLHRLTRKETKFHWGKEEHEAFQKIRENLSDEKTMAYFDLGKQIILRTEASYNEGLSAALLQKTENGMQPVH
ncbi:Retrovirus-related Pol polyprotein [Stylophora pistillata]|uniref:Retrovirus-related Pol polyprotein n=1 Tax=Stylophora pistillata TaxID=50429 RepID=A0A2B4RBB5_STYPI|nr:Retrovirus-related Pol polyprotein [Stylophora pistillata]